MFYDVVFGYNASIPCTHTGSGCQLPRRHGSRGSIEHVIATDRRSAAITSSLPGERSKFTPATSGDSLAYAGTSTSSIANNAISASPSVSNSKHCSASAYDGPLYQLGSS